MSCIAHNVCVNNATQTRRYQHSMSPGAEGLSEHFTFGLAAISRPPMQMCERCCLRCYAFVPRDVIHAHSAGCTDRLSKATDPLSSHSLQKLLLFCSPTWRRGMTHNVSPHNATARRRIINSQWPRGGGPLSARYFEGDQMSARRCAACYAFVPHVLMIAPRDERAVLLSQTTNSFRLQPPHHFLYFHSAPACCAA